MTTCKHCGYDKVHCQCGLPPEKRDTKEYGKRNTSGHLVRFNNYTDLRNTEDYAVTSRISRSGEAQRRIIEEYQPIHKEPVLTWLERSRIAEEAVSKFGIQLHLFGTKREWACHTTARMCPICTPIQQVQLTRSVIQALANSLDLSTYVFEVENTPKGLSIRITSST